MSSNEQLDYIRKSVNSNSVYLKEFDWRDVMRDGVIAEVTIGRWRGKMRLSPEDLGLPADAIKEQELSDLLHLGDKLLLPAKTLRRLTALESRARQKLSRSGFETHWGTFVPVTAYDKFRRELDECERDYYAMRDEIVLNYDDLVEQVRQSYFAAGLVAYDRLRKADPDAMQYNYASRELFAESFSRRILSNVPPVNQIYQSFRFEISLYYIPLPSLVEETVSPATLTPDQAEYQREQERQTMQRDIVAKAQDQKEELIAGFFEDIQNQLNRTVHDVCTDVLSALQKQTKLNNRNVVSLKRLVENVANLNFYRDPDIEASIKKIREDITDRSQEDRSTIGMESVLGSIITLTRSALIDLGERPPAPRDLDIPAEPTADDLQMARRQLQPIQATIDAEIPTMARTMQIEPV